MGPERQPRGCQLHEQRAESCREARPALTIAEQRGSRDCLRHLAVSYVVLVPQWGGIYRHACIDVGRMWQHIATCDKSYKMWQHMRTENKLWQNVRKCSPSVKTALVPTPSGSQRGTTPSGKETRAGILGGGGLPPVGAEPLPLRAPPSALLRSVLI